MNISLDQNDKLVSLAEVEEYPGFYCLFVYPYDDFPVEDLEVFDITYFNRDKSHFPYIGIELFSSSSFDIPSIADVLIESEEHYTCIETMKKDGFVLLYFTKLENMTESETVASSNQL